MSYIDYFYEELIKFDGEIKQLPFDEDDLRKGFFGLLLSCLGQNYDHYCTILLGDQMSKGNVILNKEAYKYSLHFERLSKKLSDETIFINSRNHANRSLIIDSWSAFEYTITFLCIEVFSKEQIDDMLNYDKKELDNILNKYNISLEDNKKINKKFAKEHLTHVPITRKYDKLYSIYKGSVDVKKDVEFLRFFGKYRNGMHSNFWYQGNNFEYTFNDVTIYFKNEEAITESKATDIRFFFDLVCELKNVTKRLFQLIKHDEIIKYPLEEIDDK